MLLIIEAHQAPALFTHGLATLHALWHALDYSPFVDGRTDGQTDGQNSYRYTASALHAAR